jgi:hypothetical protein
VRVPLLELFPCLLPLMLGACAVDQFESENAADSSGDTQAPTDDGSDWSSGSGSGSSTVGDGDGDEGPLECDDSLKRCDHDFTLADMDYQTVEVIGDFAVDGWSAGEPMSLVDGTWRATVGLPWATPVEYKFRINGGAGYIPDPNNPNQVDDGFGGFNSVLDGITCEEWECDPGYIGEFDWRDAIIYFVFVDRFFNGDPNNDGSLGLETPADWQGGDWAGVAQKIE